MCDENSTDPDVSQAVTTLRALSATLRQQTHDDPCNDGPMMQAGAIDTVLAALTIAKRECADLRKRLEEAEARRVPDGWTPVALTADDGAYKVSDYRDVERGWVVLEPYQNNGWRGCGIEGFDTWQDAIAAARGTAEEVES